MRLDGDEEEQKEGYKKRAAGDQGPLGGANEEGCAATREAREEAEEARGSTGSEEGGRAHAGKEEGEDGRG
jgi:hypothetical protein